MNEFGLTTYVIPCISQKASIPGNCDINIALAVHINPRGGVVGRNEISSRKIRVPGVVLIPHVIKHCPFSENGIRRRSVNTVGRSTRSEGNTRPKGHYEE